MNVVSIIPSKGRPDLLSSTTLSWLCLSRYDWLVVVEPAEAADYLRVVPQDRMLILDKNNQGLGYAKAFIRHYLASSHYDVAMKLDDDIKTLHDRGSRKAPMECAAAYDRAVQHGLQAFEKYPDVAAIGYPYRNELYELKQWASLNTRLQTMYLVRKEWWVGDPRVSTFEDFHNYLVIRAANKMTLRYGLLGVDNDVGEAGGGLQSFDRFRLAEAEVAVLREIYPAIVFKRVEGKRWGLEPVLKGAFFGAKGL